ncbi:MAG: hypothetical protein AVDCRST_MAG54-1610 [uncultured Actinomycetospora sp.]|uniref:DUF3592 domain-containing protein n=1 Tax=uncultured Actinomycetospora sp. TaxID=1135996 RepID=A0A6J4I7R9_9PSEU|nr:MAG: hypothetical protein AVDCRST_MAG54-1610 [uncultured Actinomycetospora sp.]
MPGRGPLVARIPVSGTFRRGAQVAVAYDPADPAHVRTVERWRPVYLQWELLLLATLLVALLLLAVTRVRRVRRVSRR